VEKNMSAYGTPRTPAYGLEIHYERDASLRAYQIVFVDERQLFDNYDVGGMIYVSDRWLRERSLSIDKSGMVFHTLMTIFAAYWTKTIYLAELGSLSYSPPHNLIDGVDITGSWNLTQEKPKTPLW
jgi:hypothetical protein